MNRFVILMVNAIFCFMVAALIAVQWDPFEGNLIDGYKGLRFAMFMVIGLGIGNWFGAMRCAYDNKHYE
jgi:hypothetical protein